MLNCLTVGLGGFVGAVCRYLLGLIPLRNAHGFPVMTLLINVLGAFAIGCIVGLAAKNTDLDPRVVLFLKTGICGGFTTFSTFALETTDLLGAGETFAAAAYVVLSVVLGVLAVLAGQYVCR